MKRLCLLISVLLLAAPLHAASTTKVGFLAYSTASSKSCGVKGMKRLVFTAVNGVQPYQGFAPDSDFDRTVTLGTKGFGNYSTTLGGKKVGAIKFTCRVTGSSTLEPVKVYLNGVQTHFLTLDSDTWVIDQ